MLRSIWMHAWDLESINHQELISFLQDCGLNACNLAFSYHGGRMFLPRHKQRKVYEQNLSAVYFPADERRYRVLRLQPHVAPEANLVREFLSVAQQADFTVNAWTVLCHNDRLGFAAPECCIQNVFGERYTHALCPSNPAVREYIIALCGDIAAQTGVASLDLEALSFMGYEHQSLHDKTGVPLTSLIKWLLSICVCHHCCLALGSFAPEVRTKAQQFIRDYLTDWPDVPTTSDLRGELEEVLGPKVLQALLDLRQQTIIALLAAIRAATVHTHLNLRLATSLLFIGGKAVLDWGALAGCADAATITFLGATIPHMQAELSQLPIKEKRSLPVYGGFAFHHPDCMSEMEIRTRIELLREAQIDGMIFYCFGLATNRHFAWLKNAI